MSHMQISTGFSADRDYVKAAREAFGSATSFIRYEKIDFALLFTTEKYNQPLLLKTLSTLLEDIPILGLSSPFLMNTPLKEGIALALFSFPKDIYFNTTSVKDMLPNNSLSLGEKLGEQLLYGCKGTQRNLSIIFSTGSIPAVQNLIHGVQERVGKSFPMIGAFSLSSIYYRGASLNNAACGVLFGGRLNFGLGLKHGWQPLGKPRHVTRSFENTVFEIDGRPAAFIYQDYFAKDINGIRRDLKYISSLYPLGIDIGGKKEYLLRKLSSIGDDESLIFEGNIPQESKVRLMISSKESCLKSTQEAAVLAKENLRKQEAKLILIFNSLSRKNLLGRQEPEEIRIIQEIFGNNVPILGAYTMAEQAPFNPSGYMGRPYFHNNSIAILAIAS